MLGISEPLAEWSRRLGRFIWPTEIFVRPCNPGNQLFRYMFAVELQHRLRFARLTGFDLPEWGLISRQKEPRATNPLGFDHQGHTLDVAAVVRQIATGAHDGIYVDCFAQRLEYFEHRLDRFRREFRRTTSGSPLAPDEIAIHVRAGDILDGIHQDYMPVPISFYEPILSQTRLRPVFVGQVGPSFYTDALRQRYPQARFIGGTSWIDDFETIRGAKQIVLSVSTFAWMAAWLSHAETIHVPVLGLFNPAQRKDVDFLPTADPRYVLYRHLPVWKFHASEKDMALLLA